MMAMSYILSWIKGGNVDEENVSVENQIDIVKSPNNPKEDTETFDLNKSLHYTEGKMQVTESVSLYRKHEESDDESELEYESATENEHLDAGDFEISPNLMEEEKSGIKDDNVESGDGEVLDKMAKHLPTAEESPKNNSYKEGRSKSENIKLSPDSLDITEYLDDIEVSNNILGDIQAQALTVKENSCFNTSHTKYNEDICEIVKSKVDSQDKKSTSTRKSIDSEGNVSIKDNDDMDVIKDNDDIPKLCSLAQEVLTAFNKKEELEINNSKNIVILSFDTVNSDDNLNNTKPTAIVKPCCIKEERKEVDDFSTVLTPDYSKQYIIGKKKGNKNNNTEDNSIVYVKEKKNKVEQIQKSDLLKPPDAKNECIEPKIFEEEIDLDEGKYSLEELITKIKQSDEDKKSITKGLNNVVENNKQMMMIVDEFEKTIGDLIKDKEKDKICLNIQTERLLSSRDEVVRDQRAVERAYIDLVDRHERTVDVIAGFRSSEELLRREVEELTKRHNEREEIYNNLKTEAEKKLNKANERLDNLTRTRTTEVAKLEAKLKKEEMKVNSLEQTIIRQTSDNTDLTNICDELIVKISSI